MKKKEIDTNLIHLFHRYRKMLSMGASKPWPDALEAFNGERTMTGSAIAEYFEPLRVWLEAENIKNNVHIGWTKSDSKSSLIELYIEKGFYRFFFLLTECVSA